MKIVAKNFYTDIVLFAQMLALAATGIILKFALPPGSGGGRYGLHGGRGWGGGRGGGRSPETVLGLHRHEWGDVHFWISVSLVAVLLFHLILHWKWIVGRFKALFRRTHRPARDCEGVGGLG